MDLKCRGTSKFTDKRWLIIAVIINGLGVKNYTHMLFGWGKITDQGR